MTRLLTILICKISLFVAGLAAAADPFTVAGVPVDATSDNAIAAQTEAMSEGQVFATEILIDRLTLESERASKGVPPLTSEVVAPLIRAMNVANEKRSADRYLGDITVAFNPTQVQQFLRGSGLNMISTQSRTRMVLPVLEGSSLWSENPWSEAWATSAFSHALTPVAAFDPNGATSATIGAGDASSLNLSALRNVGARFGVEQVLVAVARRGTGGVNVQISDVALDSGQKRNLGRISAPDFSNAAAGVVEVLQSDWKEASVTQSRNAETIPVSILYRSHDDWMRLQDVINNSSQIQDARLDALSKDGALMSLTYGGDMERLRNELSFKGVEIERDPKLGVILYRRGRR